MTHPNSRRLSPVPGIGLEGYTDEISVPAGGTIQLMIGGPPATAKLKIVRLIHGDPHPDGPGFKESAVDWGQSISVDVAEQFTDYGSYIEIPHADSLHPTEAFTLAMWYYPTLLGGGWHTLAAKWGAPGDLCYALYCCGDRLLTAAISYDGHTVVWAAAREFVQKMEWQFVAFTYDSKSGELYLYTGKKGAPDPRYSSPKRGEAGLIHLVASPKKVGAGPIHRSKVPLLFGATPDPDNPQRHWAHFNGKIGHPVLLGEALDHKRVLALAEGEDPQDLASVLGCWDLSQTVTGSRVVDVSPNGNHGIAVNAPARAVTGPWWAGLESRRYTENPQDYNAIHLHEDDLEDARWEPTAELQVPAEARSGIYAARLENGHDRLFLPFIVRPSAPRSELGYLIPTLTWQAYGSNRSPWSHTEDGVLDRALCLYQVHSDGSMIYYRTRRQPTRSWNPSAGFQHWGAHTVTANLYLVDWLETQGFEYDVFIDEDLHRQGYDRLAPYRCVIIGSHPEYWTEAMLDGLTAYLRRGGRVMYLAGNGLSWVTSLDPERPYLIEVRKGGEGDYPDWWRVEPGQFQHSTTLEVGGPWARRGRPPRSILGLDYAASFFAPSKGQWGFERLPASYESQFAFIFEGVGDHETIGDFGLNLGTAAGFEMDSVQEWHWSEALPKPVVLARARCDLFSPPFHMPVPPVAELMISAFPEGGVVFGAGSVTWSGSLSHNQYNNNVSRITDNVLRRFLHTPRGKSVLDPS